LYSRESISIEVSVGNGTPLRKSNTGKPGAIEGRITDRDYACRNGYAGKPGTTMESVIADRRYSQPKSLSSKDLQKLGHISVSLITKNQSSPFRSLFRRPIGILFIRALQDGFCQRRCSYALNTTHLLVKAGENHGLPPQTPDTVKVRFL